MIRPPVREFIFGDNRPFASCHASTVLPLSGGEVLAAWFGGSHEGHGDVAIWLSRRSRSRWEPPVCVASEPGLPHWNPVLCRSPAGRLHLFYKAGKNVPSWETRVVSSTDGGRTWSDARTLPSIEGFPPGPVKDKPIIASDGSWIAGTSRETADTWDAAVSISRDDGESWSLGGVVPLDHGSFSGKGVIQPTLWETPTGSMHMLLRSTAGRIYRSDSSDGGASFSEAIATELPNNNSGIDLEKLPDGRLALCYNPVCENWGKRTPLVLSFSRDDGLSWGDTVVLEDEDGLAPASGLTLDVPHRPNEFSYPAVVPSAGILHVTYTWKRERICYRRVPVAG